LESFGPGAEEPAVVRDARFGPVLLYVGRLGKEKNLEFLLEAFCRLFKQRPDARLIIVGDGPHRAELEQRARDLDCADGVVFVGALAQRELGAYYRGADVFVFSSLTETQGLVLVEALAHGLPVVAVDCPVTRDIVIGDSGAVTAEDADAFAAAVAGLLDEPEERRKARKDAARQVAAPFSIDALVQQLEELYLRALRVAV
jgi:glycosyltransferase involved in cell wall biosynthesis